MADAVFGGFVFFVVMVHLLDEIVLIITLIKINLK